MTERDEVVVRPDSPAAPRRGVLAWGGMPGWRTIGVVALFAVVVIVAATRTGDDGLEFEVRDMGADEVVYSRPVTAGETFRLEHTHSVTNRPVVEIFAIDDEAPAILLRELRFDEFGPNLPAGAEELGDDGETTFVHENGAYRVLHHDMRIGTVPLRVGSDAVDHTVVFADGERLRLLDVTRRGEYVELAVRG
ncbi:DUF1850 domain-containing protein [Phytoactinopolyspora halophila]|uniref:DUF1850 domain-containing protein n=1 Tax=Phytoactinopolyspora halophila TaxID=1981511 RepID=A0A329QVD7_9ACTN|nr:DUF1850 domain-containing protein [Phytoactinopolyspora halophila]RAW16390.1 DUF1850 domain-containing protein [Phytoactinopolyspora halophila]